MKFLKGLLLLSASLALLSVANLCWTHHLLAKGIDKNQQTLTNHLDASLTRLDNILDSQDPAQPGVRQTMANLNNVAIAEQKRVDSLQGMLALQQKKTLEILLKVKDDAEKFGGTIEGINAFIKSTDYNINNEHIGLIPNGTTAVQKVGVAVDELIPVIEHADDLVNSPAIKSSVSHLDGSMAHVESMLEVGDKVLHPPKQSKGQRVFQWILQTVLGNAVQGAVRR